jgi:hypothetical protein
MCVESRLQSCLPLFATGLSRPSTPLAFWQIDHCSLFAIGRLLRPSYTTDSVLGTQRVLSSSRSAGVSPGRRRATCWRARCSCRRPRGCRWWRASRRRCPGQAPPPPRRRRPCHRCCRYSRTAALASPSAAASVAAAAGGLPVARAATRLAHDSLCRLHQITRREGGEIFWDRPRRGLRGTRTPTPTNSPLLAHVQVLSPQGLLPCIFHKKIQKDHRARP